MTRNNRSPLESAASRTSQSYWHTARRPLQVLVFLLPLLALYELAMVSVLADGENRLNIEAHEKLLGFFAFLGLDAREMLFLPGVLLVVVLLVWQLLSKEKWRIDLAALGLMAVESVVLTIPLLVLARVIGSGAAVAAMEPLLAGGQPVNVADLPVSERLAISVGAGIYEELVFRMLIIALIHTILVDVAKQSHALAATVGIALSAIFFTLYHSDLTFDRSLFFLLAGLYFGVIFMVRGFGIVVAVHTLYDVVTVLILPSADASGG